MTLNTFKTLLAHQSIGARMLTIALVPSLVTAVLLITLLLRQNVDAAEHNVRSGLLSAARNLASASQYGLISGNLTLLQQTVDRSRRLEQLHFSQVQAVEGLLSVKSGAPGFTVPSSLPAEGTIGQYPEIWIAATPIMQPHISQQSADFGADPVVSPGNGAKIIGYAVAAISTAPMRASRQQALLLAAGLVLASGLLAALIAWRLSEQLTRRIRHISQTVGEIAGGKLQMRVHAQPTAELGMLEVGINRMAEATADLRAKNDAAERTNIAKSRFFAAASHDLRQPLHALSLFSEVLGQKISRQPESHGLGTLSHQIASSVSSMQALLNTLLDVSRLDANIIEVHRKHFPAKEVFERIRQQHEGAAEEKGLALKIRACECTLHTDPVLLERILLNLVSNAIRYTRHGGVVVGCRKRSGSPLIQVCDTGIGIPDDAHERIFQEYVQFHNPERDFNKGLGLGLAIVARTADLLGIPVRLSSRPGRGSVFSVEVPLGSVQQIAPAENLSAAGMPLEGLLGVIVDDEESILSAMQELFNTWKLDLIAAHSADEALSQLQHIGRTPDFLITDYRLPGNINGIEVAGQFVGQFGKRLPVLMLTGDTAPETLQHITHAGFAILHKPVQPARLRAVLMHMLCQDTPASARQQQPQARSIMPPCFTGSLRQGSASVLD